MGSGSDGKRTISGQLIVPSPVALLGGGGGGTRAVSSRTSASSGVEVVFLGCTVTPAGHAFAKDGIVKMSIQYMYILKTE